MNVQGVSISSHRPLMVALTEVHGIGRKRALAVLAEAEVDPQSKAPDLDVEQVARINALVRLVGPIEGVLKATVARDIGRLKKIGSYRGHRHTLRLPCRGQRTRSNARTRKRMLSA